MYSRSFTFFVAFLLFAGVPFTGAQVLETNTTEEIPLPAPTPTPLDPIPAAPLAAALETNGEETSANVATLPVRELEGEPIQRGPIHEAFADPLQLTPEATEPRKKTPPALIEELPPEAKPDAKNVEWIPGYWAWDEQRNDYVWVSGVWRKIPRGRTWVAGYWEETEDGHQWVPGSWLKTATDGQIVQDEVLPAPPESLEQGPTSPAPSDDYFWIPGVWNRSQSGQYAWRPGFWSQSQANWVWVPDHYVWRPTGCTYVPGYWDYTWERRGTLYAPCTFASSDLTGRVCYRPSRVIDSSQWLASLWVGPGCHNYYYGDYYDYMGIGYSPWYSYYGTHSRYYDPFYSYYRWRFPISYGIGLYGYLDGLHSHYRGASRRPSISFYAGNDWYRRSRGYTSLYGNVNLDRRYSRPDRHDHRDLARIDHARHRGAGNINQRNADHVRDALDRARDSRRNLAGYANGTVLDRKRGGPGITRAEIGTSGAPGISRSDIGRGRSDLNRDRSDLNRDRSDLSRGRGDLSRDRGELGRGRTDFRGGRGDLDRVRAALEQRNRPAQSRATRDNDARPNAQNLGSPSLGPRQVQSRNPSSDPGARPQVRQPRPRASNPQISRSEPRSNSPQVSRPRPNVSRPAPTVTRSRPNISRPAPTDTRSRPNISRPAPNVTRSRPNVSRPAPTVSRPRASASRPSSPGFSTHGMKKARGADVAKQRAAMQKHISGRKK